MSYSTVKHLLSQLHMRKPDATFHLVSLRLVDFSFSSISKDTWSHFGFFFFMSST